MTSTAIRERRRRLRYRSLLVRQMVQMKNKTSTLLMEAGVSYNKRRLHKAGYFRQLLATNPDINDGLRSLLVVCRETVVRLQRTESALVRSLERDPQLLVRVEWLQTIPAVGPITALTWALEVGEAMRFSSIKKAISYCGLCGAEKSSGNTTVRTPLSKQRNKHLQTTLIEAAKMAPRYSPTLAMLYDQEKQKGNANRATLAVARKLVAYLMAVDRGQRNFQLPQTGDWTSRRDRRGISSSAQLPGLAVRRLGRMERKLPMLLLISFETGRSSQTQSSRQPGKVAPAMEVWFFTKKEPRPRGQHTRRRNQKEFTPALLRSASGELVPS